MYQETEAYFQEPTLIWQWSQWSTCTGDPLALVKPSADCVLNLHIPDNRMYDTNVQLRDKVFLGPQPMENVRMIDGYKSFKVQQCIYYTEMGI